MIGRAEAFAFKNRAAKAAVDGLAVGLGFALALVALGALREAIGQGTLFAQADLLFGAFGRHLTVHLLDGYSAPKRVVESPSRTTPALRATPPYPRRGISTNRLGALYRGFLLAILPPGAFISLGCLIALKNLIDARAIPSPNPPIACAG